MEVYYADNHSTFSSQDEIVVMARDPAEFQGLLEALHGDDVNDWLVATFDPLDAKPNVPNPPSGIELPFAQSFPFPNQAVNPVTTWLMTREQFTGSPLAFFDGPASQFGGSVKALWLMRRGACSTVQTLGGPGGIVNQILQAVPSDNGLPGYFDKGVVFGVFDDLLVTSVVSHENVATPNGGISALAAAHGTWRLPVGTFGFKGNFTYPFILHDGIFATDYINNEFDYGGADPFALGTEFFNDNLATGVGDSIYLKALSQQSQPIPNINAAGLNCSTANGNTPPPGCFIGCSNANGVVMTDPASYPPAPDPLSGITLPGLDLDMLPSYSKGFCSGAATLLASATETGAAQYGIVDTTTQHPIEDLGGLITNVRPKPNDDSFRNVRCNFHPTYEKPSVPTGKTDSHGNPILVPSPTCEIVVRAKRLNVFPDSVELVFFDGTDLSSVTSDEYANEAFAVYLALLSQAPTSINSLCSRQPETVADPIRREFAHGNFVAH